VTIGPAVRNARRFSKKSTASRSCIAWWTIWWLRMEREARTDRQTDSLQKFLMGKVLPTPRSDDDGMSSISKLTPSKRCLENRVDSPAKRRKKFLQPYEILGGWARKQKYSCDIQTNRVFSVGPISGFGGWLSRNGK
jgi:hypothetical protein